MLKNLIVAALLIAGVCILPAAEASEHENIPGEMAKKPDGKPLTAEDFEALDKGKIYSELEDRPDTPVKAGRAIALVDAPPETVFTVLTDYDHFDTFMLYCDRVTVLEHEGIKSKVRFELDFPWPVGNRHYTLNLVDRQETIDGKPVLTSRWAYEPDSGNINDTYGAWEIMDYDGNRSFIRYTIFTDPGGKVPAWVGNRATANAVPKVIKNLRKRVAEQAAEAKAKQE